MTRIFGATGFSRANTFETHSAHIFVPKAFTALPHLYIENKPFFRYFNTRTFLCEGFFRRTINCPTFFLRFYFALLAHARAAYRYHGRTSRGDGGSTRGTARRRQPLGEAQVYGERQGQLRRRRLRDRGIEDERNGSRILRFYERP